MVILEDKRQVNPDYEPHLIVVCQAGVHSARTVTHLKPAGITATHVTGASKSEAKPSTHLFPSTLMKDISEYQPALAKQPSKKQPWLIGCGVAVVLATVGTYLVLRHNPDLLIPVVRAGVPLGWASDYSGIVSHATKRAALPQMNVQELKQLIDSKAKDYVLLDVRTSKEFQLSHIPGATLIPVEDIEQGPGIDKVKSMLNGRRLIVYCTSGHRSGNALVRLEEKGIKGTQITGGIKAWTEQIDPSLPRNNW